MNGASTLSASAAAIFFFAAVSCDHVYRAPVEPSQTLAAAGAIPTSTTTPLPDRDESVSFHGPGSSNVDKTRFPAIRFDADSFELPGGASAILDSVAAHLNTTGSSAILAGFTDHEEENRVLGERRALAVRQGLIERGANPNLLQTVSYGHDLPPSVGTSDRRVEFGLVSTAHAAVAPAVSAPVAVAP